MSGERNARGRIVCVCEEWEECGGMAKVYIRAYTITSNLQCPFSTSKIVSLRLVILICHLFMEESRRYHLILKRGALYGASIAQGNQAFLDP